MKIIVARDFEELSALAAKKTAEYINEHPGALICLAAGKTPLRMFEILVGMQNRGETDLSSVWYAGLDEWISLGPNDAGSCHKVMTEAFYGPAGIPDGKIRLFDGLAGDMERQCAQMEEYIDSRGGIGYTLLGVGMNGHIGFNEPGAPDKKGCLIVPLDDITITVSKKYDINAKTPLTSGVTIGRRTLFDALAVVLMASGAEKADIMKAALHGPITSGVPASIFQEHRNATALLDRESASLLT